MEMNSSGWYCTNNPNFDVTIPWTLPAGVPILNASISAEFVRGGETVYNHGTELSLNNTQIGNATVPQQANPAFNVPPSAIIPGARSQSVNLRSLHTNDAHYTLTTNFTITVQHGAYETRQCFAPGVVNTSSLLAPACAPVYELPDEPEYESRKAYYEQFKALAFWIIYVETFEDRYNPENQFDLLDNLNTMPDNDVTFQPNPDEFDEDRRTLQYMFARTIIQNIPYDPDNIAQSMQDGVIYTRIWGGSIDTSNYVLWQAAGRRNSNCSELDTYLSVYDRNNAVEIVDWFTAYAECRRIDRPSLDADWQKISRYIDLAIYDEINDLPNPVEGAYYVRNPNSCYLFLESGSCATFSDLLMQCDEQELINCRIWRRYTGGANVEQISDSVSYNAWISDYASIPEKYRDPASKPADNILNEYYLYNPTDTTIAAQPVQIIYSTIIGVNNYISTGSHGISPNSQFFLIGEGHSRINGETLEAAFFRHFNRILISDDPEAYRPNTCVAGMAHATVLQNDFTTTWETWVFQHQSASPQGTGGTRWFCQ